MTKEGEIFEGYNFHQLRAELVSELDHILEYWSTEVVDDIHGGFIGEINHFGEKKPAANKGAVLNARILWTFSAAFRRFGKSTHKDMADRAFNYLKTFFWDTENDGLIWEVDSTGKPVNTRKQAYAQGFGIYAFSEYYMATKSEESLNLALKLYGKLEEHFWDKKYGGYIEALNQKWEPIDDMRLSEKDQNSPKSMNTHLHIIEPYVNLYRAQPSKELSDSIKNLLNIFGTKIVDQNSGHFNLFFGMDWTPESNEVSFGHDIEGAWLLNEAAIVLDEVSLLRTIEPIALKLAEVTFKKGLDKDGSIYNHFHDGKIDTDKHWWPQAEGMVGFMDAYEVYPNEEYKKQVFKLWDFIKYNLKDSEKGEWYWRVDENSIPNQSEVKAGFWKCPYHNGRALMEVIERIEKIDNVR